MLGRRKRGGFGRLPGALLAALVLLQAALPALHELQVARDERAHPCRAELHAGAARGSFLLPTRAADAHDAHHHRADCAVCKTLSQGRPLTLAAAIVGAPSLAAAAPSGMGEWSVRSTHAGTSGPRAPPAGLS